MEAKKDSLLICLDSCSTNNLEHVKDLNMAFSVNIHTLRRNRLLIDEKVSLHLYNSDFCICNMPIRFLTFCKVRFFLYTLYYHNS